jgi:hypothetical protein
MQLVQRAQSPTELIAKVAKSALIAWSMVVLQVQKISELEAANKHLQEKKKQTKKQLQHSSVLQVQEAQQLILERDSIVQQHEVQHVVQYKVQQPRQHALYTCSCCRSLEHTARICKSR